MKPASNKLIYALVAVIVILLVTSGIGLINYQEQRELDQAELEKAIKDSNQAEQEASKSETEAVRLTRLAEAYKEEAIKAQAEAEAARRDAEEKRVLADKASEAARISEANANRIQAVAMQQTKQEIDSRKATQEAATRLRYVAQGKVMAVRSMELGNSPQLEALVAFQSHRFLTKYGESQEQIDIDSYQGLFKALENLGDTSISDFSRSSPTRSALEKMAMSICSHLTRNMTQEEWDTFVGADLMYERTCEALPANNK